MKLEAARRFALSLPETSEQPHFDLSSFRVRGKIFATFPPEGSHLHIFVGDQERELMAAAQPKAYETLLWGKRAAGLRVELSAARITDVQDLLRSAWLRKAPKRLAARFTGP
jgi:hypothetical protein